MRSTVSASHFYQPSLAQRRYRWQMPCLERRGIYSVDALQELGETQPYFVWKAWHCYLSLVASACQCVTRLIRAATLWPNPCERSVLILIRSATTNKPLDNLSAKPFAAYVLRGAHWAPDNVATACTRWWRSCCLCWNSYCKASLCFERGREHPTAWHCWRAFRRKPTQWHIHWLICWKWNNRVATLISWKGLPTNLLGPRTFLVVVENVSLLLVLELSLLG